MSGAYDGLARSYEELAAAELLATNGFGAQAVSRSYYAAFYAAEAALLSLGETRAKHSGVVSAFGQLLVRDRGVDERAGRLLRSLFERRSQADYEVAVVPAEEARQAVTDAAIVVETVDRWLRHASRDQSPLPGR